ncbi:hypothetical protein GRAN_0647 [Granulicella sibirica]|uniref:Uncharacterized protein n=1 Tax=Granulicella sibirica TaxID=2479048 RepID=A0A4Q0T2B0_9BACT|nr:hypothetical protein GRAN_0647 [Granulicella sibirica]
MRYQRHMGMDCVWWAFSYNVIARAVAAVRAEVGKTKEV